MLQRDALLKHIRVFAVSMCKSASVRPAAGETSHPVKEKKSGTAQVDTRVRERQVRETEKERERSRRVNTIPFMFFKSEI